ncbi:MAG TPA: hypothetical protein VFM38_03320 [Candidatus Limnocylindrales bacterium]|nr:hypothetical protein [Candidatus Limnocylindrales bacterium]
MGIGASAVAALLAVLERPSTWLLALVGFLVRGGWLVILAPILVLPTPVGLANVIAPIVEDIAFGRQTSEVISAVVTTSVVLVVWVFVGGLLAAVTEVETVRQTASVLDRPFAEPSRRAVWRVLGVRFVTLIPLLIGLAWSVARIVSVAYRELTVPSDVATPITFRILAGAPDAVLVLLVTWLFSEIVGGLATRRVVLAGRSVRRAASEAVGEARGQLGRCIGLGLVSAVVLLAVIALTGIATGTAWAGLRGALADADTSAATLALLVLFVGLFAGSLVILGLTAAWRSAVWTVVAMDDGRDDAGTFGGGAPSRSGD